MFYDISNSIIKFYDISNSNTQFYHISNSNIQFYHISNKQPTHGSVISVTGVSWKGHLETQGVMSHITALRGQQSAQFFVVDLLPLATMLSSSL